ncbi:DinB family protein [Flavobacterium sp. xlx-214]|uniref:DinB family protein n=1 Tax=unclassified Flavobacterium TaxID=196869 RepID=UPI0013D0DFDB|nr:MULTISPECIES: DinB family protein [unclassified Flavobacterium]MBA5793314.1 DinB family protein [Flavobacterium sp. xlx-221]QMI84122.1 DinB family protein [Flavobacterium sp. xlx-214]
MGIQKALLIELEREKNNTARILKNLNSDVFGWKPHEKSMSVGELANHIVELHGWVAFALTMDAFDFHKHYVPSKLTTVDELLDALEKGYEKNKKIIEALDEATYFENWALKAGDHIIAELPKAGAVRFIITNHLIHHRGQLSVYLRLLDIPVPGLYGPSADERQ